MALTEGKHTGEFIVSEAVGSRSREVVTLLSGEDLEAGTVLGKITLGSATAAYSGGHTGTAAVGSITKGAAVKVGDYVLTCTKSADLADNTTLAGVAGAKNVGNGTISTTVMASAAAVKVGTYVVQIGPLSAAPATAGFTFTDPDGILIGQGAVGTQFTGGGHVFTVSDGSTDFAVGDLFTFTVPAAAAGTGGEFSVVDPDGYKLKNAVVGTAYTSDQIGFTIADGTTNWTAGWVATITVAAGSGKYKQHDQDSVDGSQYAAGVLYDNVDATGGDALCVAVVRDAEVNGSELTWQSDIDASEKSAAIADLNALGIYVR